MVEIQAWSVLVEMNLTGHTVEDEQTHGCCVLAGQDGQICEIDILEDNFTVINQRNVRKLISNVRRSCCNDFFTLIQIEVPYLNNIITLLFPSNNSILFFDVEVEMFFMWMTLTQIVPHCLVSHVDNDRFMIEFMDRWGNRACDRVKDLDLSFLVDLFKSERFLGPIVLD